MKQINNQFVGLFPPESHALRHTDEGSFIDSFRLQMKRQQKYFRTSPWKKQENFCIKKEVVRPLFVFSYF